VLVPVQLKMARAALGLSVRELALRAGVADSTISRFEGGGGGMQMATLAKVQGALESEGIMFIFAGSDGGPGVRLKA
jgi:transcriptional regulator with XRE-family HTH domain